MKVVVIDDSRLARVELINQIKHCPPLQLVGEAADVEQALSVISQTQPDLLLLDIDMPGQDGFSLLQQLDGSAYMPHVIFVTAFDQYALKSFDYHARDYLLKPVTLARLQSAIAKVPTPSSTPELTLQSQVLLKDNERCYFVTLADIYAIEAIGNYCRVYLQDAKPMIYRSLSALEKKLPTAHFFRASRSWIINTCYIQQLSLSVSGGFDVQLKDDLAVEISRRQAVAFRQHWSL